MLVKSSMQLLQTVALLLALCAVGGASADAVEILDGPMMIKAYRSEFNNKIIGTVVVVGRNNLNPPPGYTAGKEYWTWTPGAAWRGTFTLVPITTVPDYYSHSWETFPHEHFDLSRTVPMPSISPEAGDRFYRVQLRGEAIWIDGAWMGLRNGPERVQEWYGRNLTSDLIGTGTAIRFTSVDPPTPGSSDVYLLIHD
ncbi:MAG: hypothetical protein ND866_08275 [Pyrinomonadaceae bacterium]|nr:hypothetical protein [Pyrinomonadaceae bacterium]